MTESGSGTGTKPALQELDVLRFDLERARYRTELLKWIVVALGAIVSFYVVDYGKLKLEQFRVRSDSQRQLLEAYLKATESPAPDIWKRKLHVLENFAEDDHLRQWAQAELKYIEEFSGIDVLYRETLKVASQLIEPNTIDKPERIAARERFNQLYWADLPYVGESTDVSSAMVKFRDALMAAERTPADAQAWSELNNLLIRLSKALRDSTPEYTSTRLPVPPTNP